MSSKNPSTKKSVNRARKANGADKSRSGSRKGSANKPGNGQSIMVPIAYSSRQEVKGPKITQVDPNSSRVINRELIGTISSAGGAFEIIKRLRCNPASLATFPWLSSIARSWEMYRFRRLQFEFIGRCATTTAGAVMLAPDYDAQDGQPSTEAQLGQFRDTVEDSPYKKFTLVLKPANMNRLYKAHVCMDDARFNSTTQDEKTIDCAQIFVADDIGSVLSLGKIWVSYDVDLSIPQSPQIDLPTGGAAISWPSTALNNVGGNITRASNAGVALSQSASQPLIEMVSNGNVADYIRFLRPWTGNVSLGVNTSTSNAFSAMPILSRVRDGVATVLGNNDIYQTVMNGPYPGGGFFNTVANVMTTNFLEGDILRLGNSGAGIPTANAAASPIINLLLGGNSLV